MGLLSDLAAVGFARFRATMEAHIRKSDPAPARLEAIGRGYVSFAPALVDVARVVGANERQIFRYVMLPGAAAWVINGLKMSLPYALIGVIVGEFLVASSGLGYRLNFYSTSYNTNGTFAMLLVMMALMMGLNSLMVLVERYALRWRAEMTTTIQPY